MKTTGLPSPINQCQRDFHKLCELGGGPGVGPPRGKVQELLENTGKELNDFAFDEVAHHFAQLPGRNPWHVCFAIGLSWGHRAKFDVTFTEAAVNVLEHWNGTDLKTACSFHLERGVDPIHFSLSGAYQLFQKVKLPSTLPDNLKSLGRAQERWMTPILSPERPKYIGSWNATSMFMVALFAQPTLAAAMVEPTPMLPPGGPIFNTLKMLHKVNFLSSAPAGSNLDDQAFEPGAIYENNALMEEILRGRAGCSLLDVHSGLYTLGTRNHWSV